ncbi:hypothetical protein G3N59_10640 [Paraburkholderia sp. Ac-20340]|uniref:hypothetical protein n=1 Tax=Paraburkholderia sp. Ac-20340 TaxID=2703888 RepID=UPI00197F0448|nr:hypothetical protein [Paraburkholderia sp. Ac-20340]MBN3853836.1 hypothetical protein [Paraburkholderia sp. Ac-20340]
MPSLLDLIAQYGNSASNPYAQPPQQAPAPAAQASASPSLTVPVSTLIDLFGRSANNPYAIAAPAAAAGAASQSTGAPMGFGGGGALQTGTQPSAPAPTVAPAAAAPQANAPLQIAAATGAPDVNVDDQGNASDAWQPSATPSGLIGALMPAAQDASTSPQKSKTLLEALGSTISSVGDKLTNLNPNESQALIASGLTMLAGNDGTRNLSQLVGLGGIAGLNSYNANREMQTQTSLAQQKLLQTAQQQQFDNALAARKQLWDENKPITVGQDQSLYARGSGGSLTPLVSAQPGVVRTVDVQGQDGSTYTVQLDRNGAMVGQPLLKSNPNAGPLGDQQQKTVNDAQTSAAAARQTYQNTATLANQLANAPDFTSGFGASVNDTMSKLTGNKDAGQQLRGQLAQFANSSILSELPPGSASDKDIQLVRNGVPSDTASKDTWQAYLSAVGRVQQAAALFQNAKSDYVTANRGDLGPLKRDATVNGQQYPAGTTLAQALSGQAPQQQQSAQQSGRGAIPYSAIVAAAQRRGWK